MEEIQDVLPIIIDGMGRVLQIDIQAIKVRPHRRKEFLVEKEPGGPHYPFIRKNPRGLFHIKFGLVGAEMRIYGMGVDECEFLIPGREGEHPVSPGVIRSIFFVGAIDVMELKTEVRIAGTQGFPCPRNHPLGDVNAEIFFRSFFLKHELPGVTAASASKVKNGFVGLSRLQRRKIQRPPYKVSGGVVESCFFSGTD